MLSKEQANSMIEHVLDSGTGRDVEAIKYQVFVVFRVVLSNFAIEWYLNYE